MHFSIAMHHIFQGLYFKMQPNDLGHYLIPPMGVKLGLKFENGVAWLRWWDDAENLLLTGDERAEKLANYLRSMGINPDEI